jgi:hypothetical protein
MYILDLPSEIQFIIIYYIKQGNYLDLAPLAEYVIHRKVRKELNCILELVHITKSCYLSIPIGIIQ